MKPRTLHRGQRHRINALVIESVLQFLHETGVDGDGDWPGRAELGAA